MVIFKGTEVYKVINKECPVYLQDLIHIKNNSYSFRYQNIAGQNNITWFSHSGMQWAARWIS